MENYGSYLSTGSLALAIAWVAFRGFYLEAKNIKQGTCGCAQGGGCGGNCSCHGSNSKETGCGCGKNKEDRSHIDNPEVFRYEY